MCRGGVGTFRCFARVSRPRPGVSFKKRESKNFPEKGRKNREKRKKCRFFPLRGVFEATRTPPALPATRRVGTGFLFNRFLSLPGSLFVFLLFMPPQNLDYRLLFSSQTGRRAVPRVRRSCLSSARLETRVEPPSG